MIRLLWANSGSDKECPELVFFEIEGFAAFDSGKRRIHISPRAAQAFERHLGHNADDAMAALIGHEIAHALRGDTGSPKFAQWLDKDTKEMERRADLTGLMLAYMAGYDSTLAVFDKIFSTLGIKGGSEGYPPPDRRKEHDTQVVSKSAQLVGIFDLANALLLTGDEDAIRHAGYLYDYMDEPEAAGLEFLELNYNRGLAALFLLAKKTGFRYALPLEVADPSVFPALKASQKHTEGVGELLKQARACFHKVLRADTVLRDIGDAGRMRNETIFNAKLANACLSLLADNPAAAQQEAEALILRSNPTAWNDKARMVKALTQMGLNKGDSARIMLQTIEAGSSPVLKKYARHNLNVDLPGEKKTILPNCASQMDGILPPKEAGKKAESQVPENKRISPSKHSQLSAADPFWSFQGDSFNLGFVMQAYPKCTCGMADLDTSSTWATGFGTYRIFPLSNKPSEFLVIRTHTSGKSIARCFRLTLMRS